MTKLPILHSEYGQSIWLDYIDRNLLLRGGLEALIEQGLRGVTSNPTIFLKAIKESDDYDDAIRDLLQADHEMDDVTLYQWLTIQDVQMAADVLEPVYVSSDGTDGFVSLEVSPHLAFDTYATVEAARHLWHSVDRPNLMIKVPATMAGLPAIEHLIAEGINVNATLLFSVERYKAVAEAYMRGLSLNPHPEKVASVASFFVSRVDTKVDAALDKIGTPEAESLKGCIAIANAKSAYQYFRETIDSEHYKAQRRRGARPQRPLWASTSTKNPKYSNVLYVEQLIGADTVNTVTPETLDAFQADGELRGTLGSGIRTAKRQLDSLDALGIDLDRIMQELEQEGVRKFADSYDQLLAALKNKRLLVAKHYADK
ncbi:transaldolase [Marinobacter salinus]|uniref:Transaldolase n=1 Tax=Marinobacter salinus TaxID=1874317 RepID=A0A1D9GIT9_9GAMM|nr:transaldolase [Marinobacter salinus]AOY87444.1 transaldolase [Marinobacter salinus]